VTIERHLRLPYIAVPPEVLEELDLAQSALGQDLLAKDIGDFLDGDTLVGKVVDGGAGKSPCQEVVLLRCDRQFKAARPLR
jgi:hypothetical protein